MSEVKKFHFIAIGGSVMHNLAIALSEAGHQVTGSDDEITEPSRSRLARHNLLPAQTGWFPEKIDATLDAILLGMHASKDNPELLKAQALALKVYSFPDFIYQHAIDKQRIVVAGSHGKTTITAIIIHVLQFHHRKFDFAIGAAVSGMENTVKLSEAPIIIIEGDEYFSSPLDATPKFLRFNHHIGVVSGIDWDHANVYRTEADYIQQFERFCDATPKGGTLVYNSEDALVNRICSKERPDVQNIPYKTPDFVIKGDRLSLVIDKHEIPLAIFGRHNLQNLAAAREVLKKLGITNEQFSEAIGSFTGAQGRLQRLVDKNDFTVFKDFAHAPSKVRATTAAVKELSPRRKLVGCLELHTYSSLNKDFLPRYKDTMKVCDSAVVYFNPEKLKQKKMNGLTEDLIKAAFNDPNLQVFDDSKALSQFLISQHWKDKNLVLMSSGTFNDMDVNSLSQQLQP